MFFFFYLKSRVVLYIFMEEEPVSESQEIIALF